MDLVGIQYLRGVAAMMVVIYHLEPQLIRMGYDGAWPLWLSAGVDIFFVISGFIMWVTTTGKVMSPLVFYKKRLARIVPIYWVLTTFVVVLMIVSPKVLQTSMFDLQHVLSSYLFIASEHPVRHAFEPVVIPGWTLNYEMFFYLLFGFSLFIPNARRFQFVLILFCGGVFLGWMFVEPRSRAGFYFSSIVLEFVFGVVIGFLFVRGVKLSRLFALALILAGGGAIVFSSWWGGGPRFLIWGLPALCVVAGVVALERGVGISRYFFPKLLGDASYSVYLFHSIALSAISQFWRKLSFPVDGSGLLAFSLVSVFVAAGAGVGLFYLVERPLGRGASRLLRSSTLVSR